MFFQLGGLGVHGRRSQVEVASLAETLFDVNLEVFVADGLLEQVFLKV